MSSHSHDSELTPTPPHKRVIIVSQTVSYLSFHPHSAEQSTETQQLAMPIQSASGYAWGKSYLSAQACHTGR